VDLGCPHPGRVNGQQYRVYTSAWLGKAGGLVRTSRPADADDGALRDAALLLTARLGFTAAGDEVGRLASSFDTMLAALHDSLTAQRQLVADASHELRTPLTSLTTNLDLLEDGAGLADPQAPALVRAAREQAGELDQLITDLLDLARYRESAPHRAARVDVHARVRPAANSTRSPGTFSASGARLTGPGQ